MLRNERGKCIYVSFLAIDLAKFVDDLREGRVIDSSKKEHFLHDISRCTVWLDDAQQTYDQPSLWAALVKDLMPAVDCTRFVISATHLLDGQQESPIALRSFVRLKWDDFQILPEEALRLLRARVPYGLPENWRSDVLEQVMIRECNGLVAALRLSIDALTLRFSKNTHARPPLESELLQYYFSQSIVDKMQRCFGEKQP
ncbi:hypothetical protein DFS34DRAFT_616767, partial [Phlyctochytrium arcticum]